MRSLSDMDIIDRDAAIDKALRLLSDFDATFDLKLPDFNSRFDGLSMVINENVCRDVGWVKKQAESIGSQIVRNVSKLVIQQLPGIHCDDDILAGSSLAVSTKLTARFLYGIRTWDRELDFGDLQVYARRTLGKEIDPEFSQLFGVDFYVCSGCVDTIYEEEFMRYRLWRDDDVKCLYRYLFEGAGPEYAECFEEGALEYVFEEKVLLSFDDFLKLISEALEELPVCNYTEMEFPEYRERVNMYGQIWRRRPGDVSCIFSEYVPVDRMGEEFLSWMYKRYASTHKKSGGIGGRGNKPLFT